MLKIICFGDSLTAGFQSPTADHPLGRATPYGSFLQERLGNRARVIVRGISGERTVEMLDRLDRDVLGPRPDYAVVLGGSNDLGWGVPVPEILENLVTLYERIRAAGGKPVALTVPSIAGFDDPIPPRRRLNGLILEYGRDHDVPVVDLFTATAEPETGRLAEAYSNDGLHLTTAGYRLIADLLYREVFDAVVNG